VALAPRPQRAEDRREFPAGVGEQVLIARRAVAVPAPLDDTGLLELDFGIDVTLAEPGPVGSGALDDPLAYRLPNDPYAFLFASGGIPAAAMISTEEVAAALADLAEHPAVPLRVPIGSVAEKVLAARDAAPYDRPFVRA
jgi:hypothetical protein